MLHGQLVPKELGHGLSVVDPPNGLRQEHADVNGSDLATSPLVNVVHYRIGHQNLKQQERKIGQRTVRHYPIIIYQSSIVYDF